MFRSLRVRKVILLLALAPVLLYGGAEGYLRYSMKSTMDQIQHRVAEFASVQYEEIETSVLGPIRVNGIAYRPHGFNQAISIQSALIDWEKPADLLKLMQAFYKNRLPEQLRISARNISVPLRGDIGEWWDAQTLVDAESPVSFPRSLFGCGSEALSSTDLRDMGYEVLKTDLRFEYGFSAKSPYVTFYARANSKDMAMLTLEGSIPSNEISLSLLNILSSIPTFANLSVSFEDASYNKRKVAFCAEKRNQTTTQFVEDNIQRVLQDLAELKVAPSTQVIDVYRGFYTKGTKLTININPYEPLGPDTFGQVDHSNLLDWLGLEVIADDVIIKDLLAVVEIPEEDTETAELTKQHRETFQLTPKEELQTHISKLSQVHTHDGKTHYAYLEKVDEEGLTLTQHLVGGSVTFIVAADNIAEVFVLY